MALFVDSTQAIHWMFSKEQLASLRVNASQAGPDGVGKLVVEPEPLEDEEKDKVQSPQQPAQTPARGSSSTRIPPHSHTFMTPGFGNLSLKTPIHPKKVPVEEDFSSHQETLVRYFLCKIPAVCAQLNLPMRVEATAMVYVQRFYLKNSVKEHHPKDIMLAAIFLAGKVEEEKVVSAESFAAMMDMDQEILKASEVAVLNAIEYHLLVFHPFRSLRGLMVDLDEAFGSSIPSEFFTNVGSKATELIRWSLASDACFVYAPGQLAYAAFIQACIDLDVTGLDMLEYLRESYGDDGNAIVKTIENARISYFDGISSPESIAHSLSAEAARVDRILKESSRRTSSASGSTSTAKRLKPTRRQLLPPTPLTSNPLSSSRRRNRAERGEEDGPDGDDVALALDETATAAKAKVSDDTPSKKRRF